MKVFGKVIFSELLRIFLLPLRVLKIRDNRILFTGLTGGRGNEYSCNPAYLCEYLLKTCPGRYEIVWAVSDPEKYAGLRKKGIRLVKHFSPASFPWLLTARVIVSNGSYAPWFPFRRGQYFINTWHGGGAYKKIENSRPDAGWAARRRARFCADNISLFVSSCRMATKKLFREAYCYRGEVLEAGMPRNDFLVRRETREAAERVREYYGIAPTEKIALYAPTYRPGGEKLSLDMEKLAAELASMGMESSAREPGVKAANVWRILIRTHRYQPEGIRARGGNVTDASRYPDMQELLAAADVLLTDYSSNIWDYSFLYRPCFLYTPDLEAYKKSTGFYVDIGDWPFPAARTQEELWENIRRYDPEENRKRIREHHRLMGSCETGHACEALAERIAQVTGQGNR